MKAKLFVAALATLAFASCSETETVEMPSSAAIKFDNAFVGNAVRAAIGGVDDLTSFYVFGGFDNQYSNVYNNTAVAREGEKPSYTWRPEYTAYWQINKTYTFDAYAANAKIDDATCDADGVKFPNAVTVDGTNDIIVATATDVPVDADFLAAPDKVEFTFKHTLSQVKFTFQTEMQNVDFTVTKVALNNAATTGTYAASAWTNGAQNATYTVGDIASTINSSAAQSTNAVIVMPQAMSNTQTVTFTLKAEKGIQFEGHEITVKMPAIELEEGHSYNFVAKLTAENIDPDNDYKVIEFTVAEDVTDWTPASQTPGTETDLVD